MELDAQLGLHGALEQAKSADKRVGLYLNSGTTLNGRVLSVTKEHVVLQALSTRDFFDAIVAIKDVSAMEVQVRTS